MFPKFGQFKSRAQKRSDSIDAQRGYGTYDPMAGGYAKALKSGIPGVQSPSDMRKTAERRTSQTIPGFGNQTMLNDKNTPGSGQR